MKKIISLDKAILKIGGGLLTNNPSFCHNLSIEKASISMFFRVQKLGEVSE